MVSNVIVNQLTRAVYMMHMTASTGTDAATGRPDAACKYTLRTVDRVRQKN